MAHSVDVRTGTSATELRELLDQAERQLPMLDRAELEPYLLRLDRIETLFETLATDGIDLRAEQTRWEGLLLRISARASQLVRSAGGQSSFAGLRQRHPEAQSFWWRLDEQVAAAQRRQLRRIAVGAVVAVIVLAIATVVYQRFLAPPPETILLIDTLHRVDASVMEEDWATATQAVDHALVTLPADLDLLLWRAVLAERQGDDAAATDFLARARALPFAPSDVDVLLGMKRLQAGDLAGATAAADAARQRDPALPTAYFILASVAEVRGERVAAIDLFEKAATLAEENDPQLAVTSRMRLGALLQQGAGFLEPQATEPAP